MMAEQKTSNKKNKSPYDLRFFLILCLMIAILAFVFLCSLAIGRYHVALKDSAKILLSQVIPMEQTWEDMAATVVMSFRLPRTCGAVLIGSALALSGATYQSIFKNPMVSPDLLGVSSGACVGAAIAILMDLGSLGVQLFAFVGGMLAVGLTITIPRLVRNESTTVLVLSGIVVSSFISSIMNIIRSLAATDTKLAEITYWTMGSLANIKFETLLPVLPCILVPMTIILTMRYRLNVLSLGDHEAMMLGLNLRNARGLFILCSTLSMAGCVCVSGTIGWIGLIIPHVARMIVGADNQRMPPIALTGGSIFLLIIDILCRTLSAAELKIGVLTGLIGTPFFIFILFKQSRNLS